MSSRCVVPGGEGHPGWRGIRAGWRPNRGLGGGAGSQSEETPLMRDVRGGARRRRRPAHVD